MLFIVAKQGIYNQSTWHRAWELTKALLFTQTHTHSTFRPFRWFFALFKYLWRRTSTIWLDWNEVFSFTNWWTHSTYWPSWKHSHGIMVAWHIDMLRYIQLTLVKLWIEGAEKSFYRHARLKVLFVNQPHSNELLGSTVRLARKKIPLHKKNICSSNPFFQVPMIKSYRDRLDSKVL